MSHCFLSTLCPLRGHRVYEAERRSDTLRTDRQSAALFTLRVISPLAIIHPCATSWPSSPRWEAVTGFSGRYAPLQIQFLCHLKGTQEFVLLPFVIISPCNILPNQPPAFAIPYPAAPDFPLKRGRIKLSMLPFRDMEHTSPPLTQKKTASQRSFLLPFAGSSYAFILPFLPVRGRSGRIRGDERGHC